jgi:hypothetical protein
MARTFTREEFYELVWSKPMTHLAKEFVLSDVALHKICRKHDIPNPPLGWWAKKAAGKQVKRIPLPRVKAGAATHITISGGELRQEPGPIAIARENARILASSAQVSSEPWPHVIVERTAAKLRKAKPVEMTGLVSARGDGIIRADIAPVSIDRFEQALNQIVAASAAIGIQLLPGKEGASFSCEGEIIRFSVSEAVKRLKHVLTEKEKAEEEAHRKKRQRRWDRNEWDADLSFLNPRFPEWDYHPTGQLSLELEKIYLLDGAPRRSFRDAKIQRLETMASDIAVGVAVMVAAMKEDRVRRDEAERLRQEERARRERALRAQYIEERRGKALDSVLEELGNLDRLRGLVASLGAEYEGEREDRLGAFLGFARQRLATQEAALSASGLCQRFERDRLFGEDDDEEFRLPAYFY